jgi:cellulose synthase/poly-beta-1,6-N-acetylglucosamine synthase-like glycosyltransferase
MTTSFWILVALIGYSYVGYGLLVVLLAQLFGRRAEARLVRPMRATLLIAAHNEAACIGRKVENALALPLGAHSLDIVVTSDGSDDDTVRVAQTYADRGVRTFETVEHLGKAHALNKALAAIGGDVVIFSDANSEIDKAAIPVLLDHFSDAGVGGVCGSLGVSGKRRGWLSLCEGLYWRYDHALKKAESALAGAVSAQGSLYAIRRELVTQVPNGVADDLINSLRVVLAGQRLVFEAGAKVYEAVTSDTRSEFGRRVRSTERGWRGLMATKELLNPFQTGFYALQLFSHKVLRRLTPFLMLALMLVNLAVITEGLIYLAAGMIQVAFYSAALLGWVTGGRAGAWASVPCFIVMGNVAMMIGIINVMRGKKSMTWKPARVELKQS